MLQIKQLSLADAETLLKISRDTFFTAFAHLNTPHDMEAYASKAFTIDKIKAELANPNSAFYFAYIDEQIAGYFKINYGDAQTENQGVDAVELERIYVISNFQNQNIGLQLLQFVEGIASAKKPKQLWLGVWEHNEKAIRFYKRNGFVEFGKHDFLLGVDKQTDLLLSKQLI